MGRRRTRRRGRRALLTQLLVRSFPNVTPPLARFVASAMGRVARSVSRARPRGPAAVAAAVTQVDAAFDEVIAMADSRGMLVCPVACRKACSWCCYVKVVVSIPEAIAIAEAVGAWPEEDRALLRAGLATVQAVAGKLPPRKRPRVPCPFLVDDCCAIYPVRPIACRAAISVDVADCIRQAENPQADVLIRGDATRQLLGEAFTYALMLGSGGEGHVDLHDAVAMLLDAPETSVRWCQGEKSLNEARVVARDLEG